MSNAHEHKQPIADWLFFVLAFAIMLARGFLYLKGVPLLHLACVAGKMALFPIAVILALRTPGKPTTVDMGILAYGLTMFVVYLINRTQVHTITLLSMDVFIYWALCRWFFARRSIFPLKATTWILSAFVALNFLLLILRPEGMWLSQTNEVMYYLLGGNYNSMGKAIIVLLLSNILLLEFLPREEIRERRINLLLLAINSLLSIATLMIVGSKTSLVGVLLVLAFGSLLLVPRSRALRFGVMSAFVAVYFVLQSWTVFRNMDTTSTQVEYFVENVLKKDMTFSKRTYVWEKAKKLVEYSPVIGYGQQDEEWYESEMEVLTAHNLVLHILIKGGWVGLSAFIVLLIIVHIRLLRQYAHAPDNSTGANGGYILLFGMWVYLFMMIFEVYSFFTLSILLIYAGYLSPGRFDR